MKDNKPFDVEDITHVNPVYDYDKVGGGHFEVFLGVGEDDPSFNMKFSSLMEKRMAKDEDLFMFVMNNYHKKTISHAIYDLYDMGFPIDEWLNEHIIYLTTTNKQFTSLMTLFTSLRNFGEDMDLGDLDDDLI